MENEALQLAHRKQYVVQTTQNTEKMFGEFSDKLIKFAEQIHFPQPNLGESSQGKQFSCLDHQQCSTDEEPGVFHRLDLILTDYSFFISFEFSESATTLSWKLTETKHKHGLHVFHLVINTWHYFLAVSTGFGTTAVKERELRLLGFFLAYFTFTNFTLFVFGAWLASLREKI